MRIIFETTRSLKINVKKFMISRRGIDIVWKVGIQPVCPQCPVPGCVRYRNFFLLTLSLPRKSVFGGTGKGSESSSVIRSSTKTINSENPVL